MLSSAQTAPARPPCLLTLAGLLPAQGGSISVDGIELRTGRAAAAVRAGIVLVPDNRELFTTLTVEENLELRRAGTVPTRGPCSSSFPRSKRGGSLRAGALSGGEQQMLAMARALIQRPKVLLVDELSMGLAPIMVERLFDAIRQVAAEGESAVVFVEQYVGLALKVADSVSVLNTGSVVLSGAAADIATAIPTFSRTPTWDRRILRWAKPMPKTRRCSTPRSRPASWRFRKRERVNDRQPEHRPLLGSVRCRPQHGPVSAVAPDARPRTLYYNERYDFYALSRADDIERAFVDHKRLISGRSDILEYIRAGVEWPMGFFIFEDPPRHSKHRGVLSRVFTPRRMAALEPDVRAVCARCLDPLVGRERFDFVGDFGGIVAARVIGKMLGIPEGDQLAIRGAVENSIQNDPGQPNEPDMANFEGALYAEYIDWRMDHPSDDLMTALLNVEFEDETGTTRRLTARRSSPT